MPRCASSTELRCNAPVIPALPRGHAAARTHLHSASALDLHPLPILCQVAWLKQVNTFRIVHKLQSYSECLDVMAYFIWFPLMHTSAGEGNAVSQPCRPTRHVVPDDGESRHPFSVQYIDGM